MFHNLYGGAAMARTRSSGMFHNPSGGAAMARTRSSSMFHNPTGGAMKRWLAVLGVLLAGALLLPQHAWSQGAIVNNGLQLQGSPLNIWFVQGSNTGTLQPATLTGNQTWTLPDASGTIITTGNASDLNGLVAVNVNAPLTGNGTTGNELGLNYNSTTLSVSGGQLTANNGSAIWNANQLQSTPIASSLSPSTGDVLTWNGSAWTAQAVPGDNWGSQVVQVNAPLTGDGTTGNELGLNYNSTTLSVSGGQLTANNGSAIWNANQLQSTPIASSLSPSTGDVLTWNGSAWTAQAVPGDNWGSQVVQVNAPLTGDGTTGNELGLNYNSTTLSVSGGQLTANNGSAIWNANQLQSTPIASSLSPSTGDVLTWNGSAWTAQAVPGDNWGSQVVQVNAPLTGDGTTGNELGLNYNSTTLSVSGGQLTANNGSAIWNANQLQSTPIASSLSPSTGDVLTWNGSAWTAQAVPGDNWGSQVVQVNAPLTGDGTTGNELGLNYNSTTLSVSGGQLTANNGSAIWNANQLQSTPIASSLSPSTGDVLTWNGSAWTAQAVPGDNWGSQVVQVNAPLTGDGTTGNELGLNYNSTTLSVSGGQLTANNGSAIWNANQLQSTPIASSLSPSTGDVLTWNGSAWTAQAVPGDNWGSQVVQVNAPLTGDGTTGNELGLNYNSTTLSVSGGQLTANNGSAIWNANQLQSTPIASGLSPNNGDVLTWNGSAWTASSISASGGWAVGGNNLGGGGTGILGTTSNDNLEVQTNGTLAIYIKASNQYVGIGTNDPQSRLHVHGSAVRVTNTTTGSTATDGFVVGLSGSDAQLRQNENASILFNTNAAAGGDTVEAQLTSTGQLAFFTTGTPGFRVDLPNNSANAVGRIRATGISFWSSMRWKEDIRPIPNALEKALALRGVNFRWKPEYGGGEDMGFIMEEVDRVVPEVVQRDERTGELLGMDYARLTALLVEALKEEHRRNEALRAEVAELRSLVEQLLRQNGERGAGSQPSTIQDAWLGQNIPNPFAGTTTIPYYVPAGVSRAELVVRDVGGRELKRLELAERGAHGQVVLEMGLLGSGTYEYALVLDGRVVAVKQMTLVR
jgi:hypothetical protein